MRMNPYLTFDGQCEAAFQFYAECLGGKIGTSFTFGSTPAAEHVPVAYRDKIMHAVLVVGDYVLMGSDCTPEHPFEAIRGCSVSLHPATAAEAERIYHALSAGGKIIMPLDKTFWAERFGMFVDRFGVPWMINCQAANSP